MAHIEIYTKKTCPYCVNAKKLLDSKGVKYTEIRVDEDPAKLQEMLTRSEGRRTVPEIFINGKLIGGCDDLFALEKVKELDRLINEE